MSSGTVAQHARPGRAGAPAVRVASVPSNHVYIRHLSWPGDGVERLPDPRPRRATSVPGQWWPPAVLDAGWVHDHADDFDLCHVHFGFDAADPDDLVRFVDALDAHGKPLVFTVHDLRNPHHVTPDEHRAHLDVLIPRAGALITLTPGAADAVENGWGRRPSVLPHPHVVPPDQVGVPRANDAERFVVGLHAKSLRASMAPGPVVRALLPLVDELPGFRLVVDVHRDVAEPDGARHEPDLMRLLHDAGNRIALNVHDYYTDDELWAYFRSLDLSVLPYRFGTHSGWLEACHDLGTTVLAPTCGFYAQQRPCLSYAMDEDGLDDGSLRDAVRYAYAQRPRWQATAEDRRAERERLAASHARIYTECLA